MMITEQYLKEHPECIFVFGDNAQRYGSKDAASLRHLPNTYGFITKRAPSNEDYCFYTSEDYRSVYHIQVGLLKVYIREHPHNTFLISKLGSGLANRYHIFENVIEPHLKNDLAEFTNVQFLW